MNANFSVSVQKANPSLSMTDILPTRKQLSRSLNSNYEDFFEKNISPLFPIAKKNGIAITADFGHKRVDYLAITGHFHDDAWYLSGL
jgi:hypothetical protein